MPCSHIDIHGDDDYVRDDGGGGRGDGGGGHGDGGDGGRCQSMSLSCSSLFQSSCCCVRRRASRKTVEGVVFESGKSRKSREVVERVTLETLGGGRY